MRKNTKRSAVIAGVAVVAIGGGAAAWAAVNGWNVKGEGTGTAKAAEILLLTATSDMGAVKVYPGLVARVDVTVQNPNEFPVKTTNAAVDAYDVTVTGGTNAKKCKDGLTAESLVAKFDPNAFVPKKQAGAAGSATVGSTVTVGNLPEECAGGTFVVKYKFNTVSAA